MKKPVKKLKENEVEERKIEEKEEKQEPYENPVINKELRWVLMTLAGLVILFLLANSFFQSLNKIEYQGLTFAKEKFGEIPLFHYSYYFNAPRSLTGGAINTGQLIQYNLYLRLDPRENNVPVEGGQIILSTDIPTYLTIDTVGLESCEKSTIAVAGLSAFLAENFIQIKGATTDESFVEEGIPLVTCDTNPNDTVILLTTGSETKILKKSNLCYNIIVSNCETLQATEKFIVQSIIDSRERRGL